jgi:hypothetical protein
LRPLPAVIYREAWKIYNASFDTSVALVEGEFE